MIALASLLFIGPAEEEKVVGDIGETDPHLLAIQNVFIAFASRSRARADNVRAGARFSQPIGRKLLALGLRHQILLLLLFGAPGVERQRIQAGVNGHRDAQKGVDRFQFFADQTERDVIETGAAVLFGNADAEQIQLGHLFKDRALKMLFLVPFFDVRGQLLSAQTRAQFGLKHGALQSVRNRSCGFSLFEILSWKLTGHLTVAAQSEREAAFLPAVS